LGAYYVAPMRIEFIAKKYMQDEFKDRPAEWFDQVKQCGPTSKPTPPL
jgi:hypothetical protein